MKTLLDLDASVIEELTERQQHQLAEVLERYLEDLERGAPADVDRLIASHPDLAVPLRRFADSLDLLHQAATGFQSSATDPQQRLVTPELASRQLGDFQIDVEI